MESRPSWEVSNGQKLTLQCLVDISTTSKSRPQHQVLFYKDDALVYNVSSSEHTESFVIPQARVFHAGKYKCTVILNSKEKTTTEYQVTVNGESGGLDGASRSCRHSDASHAGFPLPYSPPFLLTTCHQDLELQALETPSV